jgi:hypothetical protein
MIADGELQREARRVLRKLLVDGAVLVRLEDGRFTIEKGGKRDLLRIAPHYIAGFRTRDWILPRGTTPQSFVLSEPGAAWLRRAMADGDPFAAQHQLRTTRMIIDPDGLERLATANEAESPIARLKARNLIDAAQFDAAEKLRRDYTLAQLAPRLGVDLTAPVVLGRRGQKEITLTETVIAAKQRFARAMKAVGPGLSDLLYDVCCHLIGLEDAEEEMGWPRSAGKVVLTIALDRLASHYGMTVVAPRRARMRSWQAE